MQKLVLVTTVILVIVNLIWMFLDRPSWSAWGWFVVAAVGIAVGGYAVMMDTEGGL